MSHSDTKTYSFWDHLEVLRWMLIRIALIIIVIGTLAFVYHDFIFTGIIFRPLSPDFGVYKLLSALSHHLNKPGLDPGTFHIRLINFQLSGQFFIHLSVSAAVAIIVAVPYILFEVWNFIRPALYPHEIKNVGWVFFFSSFLFYLGAAVCYFLIFPLTVRFLGTYQVSPLVPNEISIQSYFNALTVLVICMGLMFELPVIAFFLSKLGILHRSLLKKGRKYAFVAILIIAALITPTTDPFTMLLVALPVYLLYECSILVTAKKKEEEDPE